MPSNHMVIRAKRAFTGLRFDTAAGQTMRIRYGYDNPNFVPTVLTQARACEAIDWGGAAVQPQDYEVLFDGPGPLPLKFR